VGGPHYTASTTLGVTLPSVAQGVALPSVAQGGPLATSNPPDIGTSSLNGQLAISNLLVIHTSFINGISWTLQSDY
jgi:cytochrome bd-type quinol oxidase subunit 2